MDNEKRDNAFLRFFKNKLNIALLSLLGGGLVLCVLAIINTLFLLLGMAMFSVCGIIMCIKTYDRYQSNMDIDAKNSENIFDATKIDFDEDIYNIDTGKKVRQRRKMSKLDAMSPFILSIMFTIMCLVVLLGFIFF